MKKPLIVYLSPSCLCAWFYCARAGEGSSRKRSAREKEHSCRRYYGVQTARALKNFPISEVLINHYTGFVEAWPIVKLAAPRANADVRAMEPQQLAAIEKAFQAVLAGPLMN